MPDPLRIRLGRTIRALRKQRPRGKTGFNTFAHTAQISPATLSTIECGEVNPSLNTIEMIATALGLTIVQLLQQAEGVVLDDPLGTTTRVR